MSTQDAITQGLDILDARVAQAEMLLCREGACGCNRLAIDPGSGAIWAVPSPGVRREMEELFGFTQETFLRRGMIQCLWDGNMWLVQPLDSGHSRRPPPPQ